MQIGFSVHLPVDASSVPFVRGLCRQALEHLQTERTVVDEVTLALSEACANAVQHAGPQQAFEVAMQIDGGRCRISVVDGGSGFDAAQVAADGTGSIFDHGSGLLLMRALTDHLEFRQSADGRHEVTFEKQLPQGSRSAVPSS